MKTVLQILSELIIDFDNNEKLGLHDKSTLETRNNFWCTEFYYSYTFIDYNFVINLSLYGLNVLVYGSNENNSPCINLVSLNLYNKAKSEITYIDYNSMITMDSETEIQYYLADESNILKERIPYGISK